MSQPEDALQFLKSNMIFDFGSDDLKVSISKIMVCHNVQDGHVFVEEGEPIEKFMILEHGVLARYKLGSSESMSFQQRTESRMKSILVDTVEGTGRVTGIMHIFEAGNKAFATVMARGPAKVWTINGQDFRELLLANADFALQILSAMAVRVRKESKISRALLKANKAFGQGRDDADDGGPTCRVLCYDSTSWVKQGFEPALETFNKTLTEDSDGTVRKITIDYTEERLGAQSAAYAAGYDAVCTFVNDTANADIVQTLSMLGVKMIAQRAAGFDRIDTKAAYTFGLTVARVPAYSPYAVAEMAISLLMAVNRKIARASNRVKMANFTLDEGLMGMDIHGKTVGVMGTGKIGAILCNILLGFGAKVICYDVFENETLKAAGCSYVSKDELYAESSVIFLMMPLLPPTRHTINKDMLSQLKQGVILINTSRGGLVETSALLEGLKTGKISGVGMDVYENEQDYFFQDWSARRIPDPDLVALLGNHNVILTAHQAFFTKEAVDKIIGTTLENVRDFANGMTGLGHPNNCIPVSKMGSSS